MQTTAGDILNWLAAGVLFPLAMLPLASLVREKGRSAAFWLGVTLFVGAAAVLFAILAVDLNPPTISLGLALTAGAGGLGLFLLTLNAGAHGLARGLAAAFASLVRLVGRLSLYLIMAMALVQFTAVILRYVFGINFIAMQESVTYMHGAVFLLAGGYALLTDDHVRVDIFYRGASPRKKALIDLAGAYLFLFPFCFVALWAAGPYVANAWAVREGSMEQSGVQGIYLLKALIPAYLVLLVLAGFVAATRAAETLRSRGA